MKKLILILSLLNSNFCRPMIKKPKSPLSPKSIVKTIVSKASSLEEKINFLKKLHLKYTPLLIKALSVAKALKRKKLTEKLIEIISEKILEIKSSKLLTKCFWSAKNNNCYKDLILAFASSDVTLVSKDYL